MSATNILAGCDTDLKVRLWLNIDGKEVPLTNENWYAVTKQFGYRTGEMVAITINRKIDTEAD